MNNKEDLKEQLINYSVRLLKSGLRLHYIQETNFGLIGHYEKTEHCYLTTSCYEYIHLLLYPKYKDKNIEKSLFKNNPNWRLITTPSRRREIMQDNSVQVSFLEEEIEYNYISDLFHNKISKVTEDLSMNIMEEGLAILNILEASHNAKKAFCIHPLFENDESLAKTWEMNRIPNCDSRSLILAMEFRTISGRRSGNNGKIRLSMIPEVNQMLLADIMQKYKTFEINQRGVHPKSNELETFYKNWIIQLCENLFDDKRDPIKFYQYCRDFINLKGKPYKSNLVLSNDLSLQYCPALRNNNDIRTITPIILKDNNLDIRTRLSGSQMSMAPVEQPYTGGFI